MFHGFRCVQEKYWIVSVSDLYIFVSLFTFLKACRIMFFPSSVSFIIFFTSDVIGLGFNIEMNLSIHAFCISFSIFLNWQLFCFLLNFCYAIFYLVSTLILNVLNYFMWLFLQLFLIWLSIFVSSEAGDAFCRAANIQLKLSSRHEAGTQFVDAANCFKKIDRNGSQIEMFLESVTLRVTVEC